MTAVAALVSEALAHAEKVTPDGPGDRYDVILTDVLGVLTAVGYRRSDVDAAALAHLAERCAKAEAERDRLRKIFDDAGQGEHNILALIDHYQARVFEEEDRTKAAEERAARAEARIVKLRGVLGDVKKRTVFAAFGSDLQSVFVKVLVALDEDDKAAADGTGDE